jgi:hypothetical protein
LVAARENETQGSRMQTASNKIWRQREWSEEKKKKHGNFAGWWWVGGLAVGHAVIGQNLIS